MWRIEKKANETIQKVQIGSTGAGNVTLGNSTLGTTTINSSTMTVSSSGAVNIKSADSSTGDINIKNGASAGGVINIANSTGTVTTNICAGSGTGEVKIGNSSNTTTLGSNTITIGGNTTGNVTIGANLTANTSQVVIGNDTLGPVYIGQAATRGGIINIGTGGTGPISIGNSNATLSLSGITTTFTSPLTLGSAPSSSGHLGYDVGSTMLTPSTTVIPGNGNTTSIASIVLGSGKYLVFINYYPTISGIISVTTLNYNISDTLNTFSPSFITVAPVGNTTYPPLSLIVLSGVLSQTESKTYYFNASNQYSGVGSMTIGTSENITFYAVRIA